ncbi:MAG: sulfatase-like hydrolase/transferase [Verrucomicrobiota bacterium JB024]|nr:sulfatase-like hydrolase/transferase [Verrucomicrobiota bacterium JB024]
MKSKPNVIVFFTDQQRADTMGLQGNPLGLTPNLDALGRRGTHCRNAFTCQPVCGPARSCLQTGQYATNTGVWTNGNALREDAVTLAKCFNEAGYRTGYIGKWHLAGVDCDYGPVPVERRGGYQDWLAADVLELVSGPYSTRLWDGEGREVRLPGYRVDAMTDAAIRYCEKQSAEESPFFLFLSFLEPHHQNSSDNYPAPPGYERQYQGSWMPPDLLSLDGTAARHWGGYCGMVKRLDEALGRLMDALISLNIADDTIVLFTSDHGCHFKTRNGEYKRSCHEASIHIPACLWGPGLNGGGELADMVSLVDLPPTLLEAAGIEIPDTMEGRSLLPLMRGDSTGWPLEAYVQVGDRNTRMGRAIRTKRWKYGVTALPELSIGAYADAYEETHLYDLENDPYELDNLVNAEVHAPVRETLRRRLIARMEAVGEPPAKIIPAESRHSGQREVDFPGLLTKDEA